MKRVPGSGGEWAVRHSRGRRYDPPKTWRWCEHIQPISPGYRWKLMASAAIHRHVPRGGSFLRWNLPPTECCISHCPTARSPFKASVTLAPHSRRCCTRQGAIAGVRCQRRRGSARGHRNRRHRRWCRRHPLAKADIFAPCALGGVIDEVAAGKLRAKVVCGAANNQLATTADGDRLAERDILYAPDYIVNAGGIINVAAEYLGWPQADSNARVEATADRLADVFTHAETH